MQPTRRHSRIRVAGLVTLAALAAATLALAGGEVKGKFMGDGKPAKLVHAIAVPGEKWQNEDSWSVVVSEKDGSAADKPDFDAFLGRLGSAVVIHVTPSGRIFGTEVWHAAMQRQGFGSAGTIKVEDLKIDGKTVAGHFHTDGPDTFFDETWELDITVSAPIRK